MLDRWVRVRTPPPGPGLQSRISGSDCRRARTTPAASPGSGRRASGSSGTRRSSRNTRFCRPSARFIQRPQLDTRRVHRREEVADALVSLRVVGVGVRGDDEPVAVMAGGAERLLAVDHPLVAVEHGPVRNDARSEPELGSVYPSAHMISPAAMPGRNAAFCSSVPRRRSSVRPACRCRRSHPHADDRTLPARRAPARATSRRRRTHAATWARASACALLLPELAIERPPVGILLEVPLETLVLRREFVVEPRSDLVAQRLELRCGRVRDVHPRNLFRTRRGAPPTTVAVVQKICGRERVQGAGRLRLGRTSHHGEAHR